MDRRIANKDRRRKEKPDAGRIAYNAIVIFIIVITLGVFTKLLHVYSDFKSQSRKSDAAKSHDLLINP